MSKIVKETIKVNGHDLSDMIYCFKGIVESNPILKREPAEALSKTSHSIQNNYAEHFGVKLEELDKEYQAFAPKFMEGLPKDEDGKPIRTEETDNLFMKELAALGTIEKQKEILNTEIEMEIWKVPFHLVKELNYALSVRNERGDVRIPNYSVIEKYNLIFK
jgi:hypothetical protein